MYTEYFHLLIYNYYFQEYSAVQNFVPLSLYSTTFVYLDTLFLETGWMGCQVSSYGTVVYEIKATCWKDV